MPEEYQRIPAAPRISRADLAALVAVKVPQLAKVATREPKVAIDISGSWAREHIARVLALDIMDVYPNHTFQPGAMVRRGDLARAAARVLDLFRAALGQRPPPPPTWRPPTSTTTPRCGWWARASWSLTPDGAFEPWRPVTGPGGGGGGLGRWPACARFLIWYHPPAEAADMDERELLRSVPIFSELSDQDITSLARVATRRRYPKDTVVFFENEEGDFFFMILEGRIKVTILGDDGREIILSMLGPGDFFGEMALLDNEPRSATAIAVEDSELLFPASHRLPERDRRQPRRSAAPSIKILTAPPAAGQPPDLDPGPARRLRAGGPGHPRHGARRRGGGSRTAASPSGGPPTRRSPTASAPPARPSPGCSRTWSGRP